MSRAARLALGVLLVATSLAPSAARAEATGGAPAVRAEAASATPADRSSPVEPVAARAPREPGRTAIFVEVLGRGGLWGLGVRRDLHRRIALGAVGSFTILDGQRVASLSPFVTAYLAGTRRHRWFAEVGPQLVHVATPSPVPEWSGASETGVGAQLATGYERRGRLVVRAFAMAAAGKAGLAPWLGVDLGWSL